MKRTPRLATPVARPVKESGEKKSVIVAVRLTSEQRRALQAAADRVGVDLSSWLRMLGLEAARAVGIKI